MIEERTAIRFTKDPNGTVTCPNGKPYTFEPPQKVGDVVELPRQPRTVKDLVQAGVAERLDGKTYDSTGRITKE
jgi:hypothetical protein